MLLSIVMPVYHAEGYLRERIGQLLTHDLDDVQLITVVCEDGYDCSAALCEELLDEIENAVIIVQPDEGLSVARNTGLEAATGKYVLFMDSDDILLDGFEMLKQELETAAVDVVVCKFVLLQKKGRDIWPAYQFPALTEPKEAMTAIFADLPDSIWNVWRYACRREFLLRYQLIFVPGLLCEDVEWTPRMLDKASGIAFFETPVYGYYYNGSAQLSRRVGSKRTTDINRIVAESIPLYQNEPYGEPLCCRLIRESFYSVSGYCRFGASDRKAVRPYIEACVPFYNMSPDKQIGLFLKTYPIVPLYVWSVALSAAKTLRGGFKWLLGANRVRTFHSYEIPAKRESAQQEIKSVVK